MSNAKIQQSQVENTKAILESGDEGQLATLTKNELVGDLFYATIYSYLALNDVQDQIQAKAAGVVNYRLPSFGLFGSVVVPSYWFGIPEMLVSEEWPWTSIEWRFKSRIKAMMHCEPLVLCKPWD